MNERDLEQHRLHRVGFVFQFFNLMPSITAFENLELPMVMAGMPDAECHARARKLLALVGLEAKGREAAGGAERRRAAARRRSPLRWRTIPRSSLPTSRPATSIRPTPRRSPICSKSLATEHGKTVIMVSHDPKTVEVFPTVHAMRDGLFTKAETAANVGVAV